MTQKSSSKRKVDSNPDRLVARDAKYVLRPWSGTGEPVPIVEARGCTVTDAYGKEFIDFTTGYFVNQAGHCHPRVIQAATQQLSRVTQVSGRHTTIPLIDLAERLVEMSPGSLDKAFFATGGSEANEFALKMARNHTGKTDMCAVDNAYHGLTLGVLGGCASAKYRETAGVNLPDNFFFIPTPYCYRCKHVDDCATQCLDGVEAQLDARPETAAIIAEPVQAVGGIIPPETWWVRLDEIRRNRGLLLILDEIQTGLGRTGKMFAAEHYGLEPEIMSVGKGISGGVGSLGAVLVQSDLVKDFFAGTTPTNAGNAVSAAAGVALIDTIIDEGLLENCTKMGDYFTRAVSDLRDPWVGDIRFKGLLGGVELVVDRSTKGILPKAQVVGVKDALHDDGMLITVSGPHGNVLRLQPPLSVTSQHIDAFTASLRRALDESPTSMNLFAIRKQLDKVLHPIVSRLSRLPLHANDWTLIGAFVGLGCAVAFLYGKWWLGLGLLIARGLIDHIDGYVARNRNQRSTFGAVMDDVTDRWVLGIIYAGGCLNLAYDYPHVYIVLGFGITGSLSNVIVKLSVYAEAQQDAFRDQGKIGHPIDVVGIFGSAEFIIYFGTGVLFTALFDDPRPMLAGVWSVAIMSHLSLLQRVVFAWKRYRRVDPAALRAETETAES